MGRALGRLGWYTVASAALLLAAGSLLLHSLQSLRPEALTFGATAVEFPAQGGRTTLLTAEGQPMAEIFEKDRQPVAYEQIAPVMTQAVVAAEDQHFWTHSGVDWPAVVRAGWETSQGNTQGGSTITQQLVKNTFLTADRTVDRKLRELVISNRVEQTYDKQQILERYLNTVYFGNGAYGVKAAASRYFAATPESLTLPQAAFLAGVIRSPSALDPLEHPQAALLRREWVLGRMVEDGYVSELDAQLANAAPLPTSIVKPVDQVTNFFTEEVRRRLLEDPRLGATAEERHEMVYNGGLVVQTTLDPRLQFLAASALGEVIPQSQFLGGLVSIDNATGAVRAMVGGDYGVTQYNIITQGRRSTGSSFKPIVLAAALEQGYSPDDAVNGAAPCVFNLDTGERWILNNYSGEGGGGYMSVRSALAASNNCAAANMLVSLAGDGSGWNVDADRGAGVVVDMARKLGISSPLKPIPSLAVGTGEVTPLEMAEAFSVFAADGVHREPIFYSKVTLADGTVLVDDTARVGEKVLTDNVARGVTDVLRGVVDGGTGTAARVRDWEVAGKTGTAEEWSDAWFVGYTPVLTTAVWMGSPEGSIPMINVGGRNVTGGSYPAMTFSRFMTAALDGVEPVEFSRPDPSQWPRRGTITPQGRR